MSAGMMLVGLKLKHPKTMIKTPLSLYTAENSEGEFCTFTPWQSRRKGLERNVLLYGAETGTITWIRFLASCILAVE